MAKYKLKRAFFASGKSEDGKTLLLKSLREGDIVEGTLADAPGPIKRQYLQVIITEGAVTRHDAKAGKKSVPYSGKGIFSFPINANPPLLEEVKDAEKTGGDVAKTEGSPAPASKLDWKKVATGFIILALIAVILAYVLKKRSAKELITFGLIGGVIGGIGMFFLKDKKIPVIDDIAARVGGKAGETPASSGDLPGKMATLGKKSTLLLLKAFGLDKDKAKWDEMNKTFDDNMDKLKQAYAGAVEKLTADEKKAVDESATFALKQMEAYASADASGQDKMAKENEAFQEALRKKYPGVAIEKTMEKLNAAAKDVMAAIMPKQPAVTKSGESKWVSENLIAVASGFGPNGAVVAVEESSLMKCPEGYEADLSGSRPRCTKKATTKE